MGQITLKRAILSGNVNSREFYINTNLSVKLRQHCLSFQVQLKASTAEFICFFSNGALLRNMDNTTLYTHNRTYVIQNQPFLLFLLGKDLGEICENIKN